MSANKSHGWVKGQSVRETTTRLCDQGCGCREERGAGVFSAPDVLQSPSSLPFLVVAQDSIMCL